MDQSVLSETKPSYRIVTINRPERLNAMDRETVLALIAALDAAEADPACRALILTGAGRGFCAGADLAAPRKPGTHAGNSIEETWNPLARRLHNFRMPTIAAVNGVAAGAGANVALGCDIVLAAKSARFLQAFAKIGLVPDCGGTFHLPRLVGEARARALAMLALPVMAEQAEKWGMIWQAVDDATLMEEAETLAAHLATQPTHALVLTRKALRANLPFDAQLDLERDYQAEASRTPDHKEGKQAFLEKRPPIFTGAKA